MAPRVSLPAAGLAALRAGRGPPGVRGARPPSRSRSPPIRRSARRLLVAYVRRSGDIMTDRMRPTIWLIDTRTGEQMPLAAGRARTASRAGRPTATASPTSRPPKAGPRNCSCAGWRAANRCGSPACPTADQPRLVARRPPDRLFDVRARRGHRSSARCPPKPEGAQWARAARRSSLRRHLPHRRAGLSRSPASATSSWSPPTAARRAS